VISNVLFLNLSKCKAIRNLYSSTEKWAIRFINFICSSAGIYNVSTNHVFANKNIFFLKNFLLEESLLFACFKMSRIFNESFLISFGQCEVSSAVGEIKNKVAQMIEVP